MNRLLATLTATLIMAAAPAQATDAGAPALIDAAGRVRAASVDALPLDPESTTRAGLYATPHQAHAARRQLGAAVLLVDVRTLESPRRSVVGVAADLHAPLFGAAEANPTRAFVAALAAAVAERPRGRATPILLLCNDGRLAAAAAEELSAAGFANPIVITGGLHGEADGGRPGWIAAGLPVVARHAQAAPAPAGRDSAGLDRGPGAGALPAAR